MPFQIEGKTALVTGANRGIGKAITEALLNAGATKVYAAVRNTDSAQPLVDEFGDRVVPIAFDLTDDATIRAAAETASDVDLVVNNAGVLKTSDTFSGDAFDSLSFEIDTNVYGLMRTTRAFAPVLKANGGGALAQLNSVVSMKTFPEFTTYCASKAASYAITQALRTQLAEQGTAVFSVHPGPIKTDMGSSAGLDDVAEPPSLVGEALLEAFKTGDFHVWPDSMAKQVGGAYQSFSENVITAEMAEA
ncbi:MAG: SDR family oxidoreductase [Planctomycetota bacterium]